ncbi:hypothetical protein [Caldalkalibacillus salinus]|uniref:response regulator aspartate phosphatase n=1 Tax=Caldalkalibacillus salinus TaxID=2803787 RepID=UPI001923DC34|nr:hypothetical protein [Caldalkalibacillus salinus]
MTTITSEEIAFLLNDWYKQIRSHNVSKAELIRENIHERRDHIRMDQDSHHFYTLLEFRHHLMTDRFSEYESLLATVERHRRDLNDTLQYYFHFFKGLYFWRIGQFTESLEQYRAAEKHINHVPDHIEEGEFHYRVAAVNYDIGKNVVSIEHTRKAQYIFNNYIGHGVKYADCENLLGVNCIAVKQYEDAEQHLITALDIAQKNNDEDLVTHVKYNLGYLYSEQSLSEVAIRHLNDIYNKQADRYKTCFLLAREYFRVNKNNKAYQMVADGLESCRALNNEEYLHHLNILEAYYSNRELHELEPIMRKGIDYFNKEDLWAFAQEYSEKLAQKFYQNRDYEQASHYFNISLEAKRKITEKEALK